MGLHMYLHKGEQFERVENHIQLKDGNLIVQWRKAYAIYTYFDELIEEDLISCQEYIISTDELNQFLSIIDSILANPSLLDVLLPTPTGFLFRSSDYEDWYVEILKQTKIDLTKALLNFDEKKEFWIYKAWW